VGLEAWQRRGGISMKGGRHWERAETVASKALSEVPGGVDPYSRQPRERLREGELGALLIGYGRWRIGPTGWKL
jgi:hypothetical protein